VPPRFVQVSLHTTYQGTNIPLITDADRNVAEYSAGETSAIAFHCALSGPFDKESSA